MFYLQVHLTDNLKIVIIENLRQFSYVYVNNIRKDIEHIVQRKYYQRKRKGKKNNSIHIRFEFIPQQKKRFKRRIKKHAMLFLVTT